MATARVIEPIVGVAAGEEMTIYVSLREAEAGSERDVVVGENADSLLTVGSHVVGGVVVNGASRDEFEIAGGLFLVHDSDAPMVISVRSQSCLTDGEQEMQESVAGYSTGELVEVLRETVQDPPEPTSVEPPATTVAGGG
ncbi:MAG: hypothetical protein WKF58_06780 [Ilumatobacteraceae bacterium]